MRRSMGISPPLLPPSSPFVQLEVLYNLESTTALWWTGQSRLKSKTNIESKYVFYFVLIGHCFILLLSYKESKKKGNEIIKISFKKELVYCY